MVRANFVKRRSDVFPVLPAGHRFADLALHGIVCAFVRQVTRNRISAMLSAIYKSPKKPETYLYVLRRDDFSQVPPALLATFGAPQLVTVLDLTSRATLAGADLVKVRQMLTDHGYYLQLPPPPEDLLKEHKNWLDSQNRQ